MLLHNNIQDNSMLRVYLSQLILVNMKIFIFDAILKRKFFLKGVLGCRPFKDVLIWVKPRWVLQISHKTPK